MLIYANRMQMNIESYVTLDLLEISGSLTRRQKAVGKFWNPLPKRKLKIECSELGFGKVQLEVIRRKEQSGFYVVTK